MLGSDPVKKLQLSFIIQMVNFDIWSRVKKIVSEAKKEESGVQIEENQNHICQLLAK